MSSATFQFRENRLAKLVLAPGGVSEPKAVAAAEANLATIKADCVAEVDRAFDLLKQSLAQVADDAASKRAVYANANAIAGIAGCCGLGEMGEAAFSLCELVDRLVESSTWDKASIAVHLDALNLLRSLDEGLSAEGRRSIVDGLRNVAGRVHVPSAGSPPAPKD